MGLGESVCCRGDGWIGFRMPISPDATARLRRAKLIEGRRPHLRVSADVAAITGRKADYIRTRTQDDAHYSRLVVDYLEQYGGRPAERSMTC